MSKESVKIREIFTSVQGEGLYVGEKQLFIRFCYCNLSCAYCDTDFLAEKSKDYTLEELFEIISNSDTKVVSFTGGEPLCECDFLLEFLKRYKEKLNKKIYLETNGTLYQHLEKLIEYVDIVAMDIKLKSATKEENKFVENKKFLEIANKKEAFIKVVFDNNIIHEEILSCVNLAKENQNIIVLQPKMPISDDLKIEKIFNDFYKNYKNIRLIPQTHKFLNLL